jgi:hypothetical protein
LQERPPDPSLRRMADLLLAEFGGEVPPETLGLGPGMAAAGGREVLTEDQRATVARLREALAAIAWTLGPTGEDRTVQMVQIAIDGAEFVIRSELAHGDEARVLDLLPSFVFLVALTVADRDRALGLARRTEELVVSVQEGKEP